MEEDVNKRPLYWQYPHYANQGGNPGSVIRLGDFKLIDDLETGKKELYDLSNDIGEKSNLYETNPEKATELEHMLNGWLKESDVKPLLPNPEWNRAETVVNNAL